MIASTLTPTPASTAGAGGGSDLERFRLVAQCARNPRYGLRVHEDERGLFRIVLADSDQVIPYREDGLGLAVRELYTFRRPLVTRTISVLSSIKDPPAYCDSLTTDWNRPDPDGPIYLDSSRTKKMAIAAKAES